MIHIDKSHSWPYLVPALFWAIAVPYAQSQVNSNTATITLNATLGASVTVAATPSNVNFTLQSGGAATGTPSVNITTTWILGSQTSVKLVGYFSSATTALSDTSGNSIPTSEVFGQLNAGSFSPFTETTAVLGTSGASLTLFTQTISSSNLSSNRSDILNLKIDLTSQPQLPAGTYTGTLTLQAQAI